MEWVVLRSVVCLPRAITAVRSRPAQCRATSSCSVLVWRALVRTTCGRIAELSRGTPGSRLDPVDPTHTAIGTWSGGRFMHFGVELADDRLLALLRPDERIRTVLTADAYGAGEADRLLGRALDGVDRDQYCLVGAVGHDFYEGEREGAKGFPRFTDPRLREPGEYGSFLRGGPEASARR